MSFQDKRISSKLPGKYGGGGVSCCYWAEENGAGGGINRLRACRLTGDITKLGADAHTVAFRGW